MTPAAPTFVVFDTHLRKTLDRLRDARGLHGMEVLRLLAPPLLLRVLDQLGELGVDVPLGLVLRPRERFVFLRREEERSVAGLLEALRRFESANAGFAGISLLFESNIARDPQIEAAVAEFLKDFPPVTSQLVFSGRFGEWFEERLLRPSAAARRWDVLTPRWLTAFVTDLLRPTHGMTCCDPAAGSATLLTSLLRYARSSLREGLAGSPLTLHGQEISQEQCAIARVNLAFHGVFDARIEQGDSLRAPRLIEGASLLLYDRVVSDIPWGRTVWRTEEAGDQDARDPYHRFDPAPTSYAIEYAFLQHCHAILRPGGRAAVTVPASALSRSGSAEVVRKRLLERNAIEAVFHFPHAGRGMRPPYAAFAVILLRNMGGVGKHPLPVAVATVDAPSVTDPADGDTSAMLHDLAESLHAPSPNGSARVQRIDFDAFEREGWSLVPTRYQPRGAPRKGVDLDGLATDVADAERRRNSVERELDDLARELRIRSR